MTYAVGDRVATVGINPWHSTGLSDENFAPGRTGTVREVMPGGVEVELDEMDERLQNIATIYQSLMGLPFRSTPFKDDEVTLI